MQIKLFFLFSFFIFFSLHATKKQENDIHAVSRTMGHLLQKDFKEMGIEINVESLIEGLQEAQKGKPSPMSEEDWIHTISILQEKSFEKTAEKNLQQAISFLKENQKKKEIRELIKDKLQYRIENEGSEETVQSFHTPLIRYKGSYLDGKVFGESQEGEIISFDETIPGFSKGLIGMKKNEKRTLFIHPELGYGKSGYLQPNALLVYEVEVLEVDVAPHAENPFKRKEIAQ